MKGLSSSCYMTDFLVLLLLPSAPTEVDADADQDTR